MEKKLKYWDDLTHMAHEELVKAVQQGMSGWESTSRIVFDDVFYHVFRTY